MNAATIRQPTRDQRGFLKMSSSPYLNRAGLAGANIIRAQMADDFRVIAANAGAVTADDLEILGWSPAQIETHARDARRIANARSEHRS